MRENSIRNPSMFDLILQKIPSNTHQPTIEKKTSKSIHQKSQSHQNHHQNFTIQNPHKNPNPITVMHIWCQTHLQKKQPWNPHPKSSGWWFFATPLKNLGLRQWRDDDSNPIFLGKWKPYRWKNISSIWKIKLMATTLPTRSSKITIKSPSNHHQITKAPNRSGSAPSTRRAPPADATAPGAPRCGAAPPRGGCGAPPAGRRGVVPRWMGFSWWFYGT